MALHLWTLFMTEALLYQARLLSKKDSKYLTHISQTVMIYSCFFPLVLKVILLISQGLLYWLKLESRTSMAFSVIFLSQFSSFKVDEDYCYGDCYCEDCYWVLLFHSLTCFRFLLFVYIVRDRPWKRDSSQLCFSCLFSSQLTTFSWDRFSILSSVLPKSHHQ